MKPAAEFFVVARKPLRGTVAANVLAHGTGALNIDASRIGTGGHLAWEKPRDMGYHGGTDNGSVAATEAAKGRWPANVVLDETAAAILDEQSGETRDGVAVNRNREPDTMTSWYGKWAAPTGADVGYGGRGGASRFYYVAKASRAERNVGLDGLPETERRTMDGGRIVSDGRTETRGASVMQNHHPTVKPVALMRWLVRLVTPPGGLVLDPFTGSGTTGVACVLEGFDFIGCEQDAEYAEIARRRIAWFAEHGEGALEAVRVAERAETDRSSRAAAGQLGLGFDIPATPAAPRDPHRTGEESADRRYADRGGTNFSPKPGTRRFD